MTLTDNEIKEIKKLCLENRKNILTMVYTAKSGHIAVRYRLAK